MKINSSILLESKTQDTLFLRIHTFTEKSEAFL